MAKFYGPVGFAILRESSPGIWKEEYDESHSYKGDVSRRRQNWQSSSNLNSNLDISTEISIIGDAFLYANFPAIRYILWDGVRYEVSSVVVERPRLILTVKGVFNVATNDTSGETGANTWD